MENSVPPYSSYIKHILATFLATLNHNNHPPLSLIVFIQLLCGLSQTNIAPPQILQMPVSQVNINAGSIFFILFLQIFLLMKENYFDFSCFFAN